jgi:hypothetical protein
MTQPTRSLTQQRRIIITQRSFHASADKCW